jgi:putative two-component system response regulator
VIFVTAMSEVGDEMKGFALGAVDYITKPISPPIVEARVRAHLENKHARDFIEDRNRVLQRMLLERTREFADAEFIQIARSHAE